MITAMGGFLLLSLSALALTGRLFPKPVSTSACRLRRPTTHQGTLLLFAAPLSADNGKGKDIDIYDPNDARIFVAGRDVAGFGADPMIRIDAEEIAFPKGLAALALGTIGCRSCSIATATIIMADGGQATLSPRW